MKLPIINGNIDRVVAYLATLEDDKRYTCEIKEQKESKSIAQLRTVHGWFRFISIEYADATGTYYSPDAWKVYFKDRFGVEIGYDTLEGEKREQKSFEKYNVKEMSELMDNINHFCGSEFSIFVPLPGEPEE